MVSSIIIAAHSRAYLLPRAAEIVLGQNYIDWELINVYEGSTDHTKKVVEDFHKQNNCLSI